MSKKIVTSIVVVFAIGAGLASFLLLSLEIAYCFQNESGHGGAPSDAIPFFIPAFVIGIFTTYRGFPKLGLLVTTLGVNGMIFSTLAETLNLMHSYEDWISLGMPGPNPQRILILSVASVLILLSLLLPFFIFRRSKISPP